MDAPVYEIINPSDKLTMRAVSDEVAALAGLVMGRGQLGVERCEDQETVLPLLLFASEERMYEAVGVQDADEFNAKFAENRGAIADALASVMMLDAGGRRSLEAAWRHLTPEQLAEAKAEHDDACRSSLSTWAQHAWKLAEDFREPEEVPA